MSDFTTVREHTESLCAPLEIEDHVVQPCEFVSPPKWHLAHTTWFFENFCLKGDPFNCGFSYLFNSYYESQGPRIERANRGLLSRPTVREIREYRKAVDQRMREAWSEDPVWLNVVELGLEHEMQHQELLLMDIKYILFTQPGHPSYASASPAHVLKNTSPEPTGWTEYDSGVYKIGYSGSAFSYDNESPRHREFVESFSIRRGLSTNAEFREFISDGGYERPELWLSDGWAWLQRQPVQRRCPLYWLDHEREYSLSGVRPLSPQSAVTHVNYYEADAFARWSGARLPTEAEWEVAFTGAPRSHVWQWTASSYLPYPGYRPMEGAFAEYNGKFMSGQMVMRGGCFATPVAHYRSTYRNFFYPEMRWQFSSIRLAR